MQSIGRGPGNCIFNRDSLGPGSNPKPKKGPVRWGELVREGEYGTENFRIKLIEGAAGRIVIVSQEGGFLSKTYPTGTWEEAEQEAHGTWLRKQSEGWSKV